MSWHEEKKVESLQEIARGLSGVERALRDLKSAPPSGTDIWQRLRDEVAAGDDGKPDPPVELLHERAVEVLRSEVWKYSWIDEEELLEIVRSLREDGYVLCQVPVDDE